MTTIYLSTKKRVAYYLTSITAKQKEELYEIKNIKDINKSINAFDELSILWGINCNGILKIGETSKIKYNALYNYIGWFKGKDTSATGSVGYNREIHYRNYLITEERQKVNMHLINHCQDSNMSITSALKILKDEWTILWEVPINTPMHSQLQTLLKDKTCYIESL